MSWAVGYDTTWQRDVGYGVPSNCDHPDCDARIHRGLSYVCGSDPMGGEYGCGLYFCEKHLSYLITTNDRTPQLCKRCIANKPPYDPTPDLPEWIEWKRTDESWAEWRREHPEELP
jgi:hypothetical protein